MLRYRVKSASFRGALSTQKKRFLWILMTHFSLLIKRLFTDDFTDFFYRYFVHCML